MKTEIKKMHIENDMFNRPKLILTDENNEEWVMSSETVCSEGGQAPKLNKKKGDWFFDPKNKN